MAATKKNGSADKGVDRPLTSSRDGDDSTAMVVYKKNKTSVMASNSAKVSSDKVAKCKAPFRYRWQKNGRFEYQDALIKANNADSAEDKNKAVRTKKPDAMEDEESDNETIVHQYTGGKTMTGRALGADEESDIEFKQEEGSDDDYEGATASKKPITGRKKQQYNQKKGLQPNPNGRVVGRKLVMWHRPRMVEKLMLHLQYECHRAGIKLPWDKAVERLSSGSSGVAGLQHLNKLRDVLITEGHMVPPLLGKYSVPQDPTVRGYVRDMDAEKPTDTRVVRWGDAIEDPKENLEVEGVIRGSGNYRRGLSKALEKVQKATGERRNRIPVELRDKATPRTVSNSKTGTKKGVKRSASVVSSRSESLDPAEMDSEEDYDPSVAKKKGKYGLRKVAKPIGKYKVEASDDDVDEETDEEIAQPIRRIVTSATSTPQAKRLKECDTGYGLITPPSNKPVILNLRPDLLKRFPAGTGLKNEVSQENTVLHVDHSDNEMEQVVAEESRSDFGAASYDSENRKSKVVARQYPQTSIHPLAQQMAHHAGYQGMGMHGLKAEYDDAIRNGLDPMINGLDYKKKSLTVNSQAFAGGESRVSSAYKLSAPPAYLPTSASRQSNSNSPLAGTSTGAFRNFPGSANGNALSRMSFDAYTTGYGGQSSSATQDGTGEQLVVDRFYSGNNRCTSGTDMFNSGINSFGHYGLPFNNYDGNNDAQTDFGLSVEFGGNDEASADAPAAIPSATKFQIAADNTAHTAIDDFENTGDTVSEAHSSPAHYIDYLPQEADDNKENREEWFSYSY